ncbi:MAG: preprotein translocase subunit SecG [Bacteroidota bacterium]|jgi:preprotein translocase subunit SecG
MTLLFIILLLIASFVLGFVVLVQNPKGGGLSGTIAGFNNQFMGVKQTTDVLEKGTWIFAAVVGVLCLVSSLFISGNSGSGSQPGVLDQVPVNQSAPKQAAPQNTTTLPVAPAPTSGQ